MHDVRRTFATELYKANVPIKRIQYLMGHANISQTFSYIMEVENEEADLLESIG